MTKQLVWMGTAVMTTLLALLLLWQFRTAVVFVLVSLALAAAVRPLINRWARRGLVVRLVLILLFLVALGVFILLLVLSAGADISDFRAFAQQISADDVWRQPEWLQGIWFQQLLDTVLPPPSEFFAALIGEQGQLVLPVLLGFTQGVFTALSSGLIVLFLSFYWSIDQIHFERLWLSLLPPGQRTRVRDIWQTIESDLGAYIRSEIVQSLLAVLLLGLGYWVIGAPYPTLLALTGALALLIPIAGATLAVMLPLLLGLLTGEPVSLLAAVYTLFIVAALKMWIEPRLSHRRQANPMLTVIFLIALADAFGLLGIIIAPPLSAACQILWNRLVSHRAVSGAAAQVSDLKARHTRVWATIQEMDDSPSPLIISSMERLNALIEKAEPTLETAV
ncbi:MAG: AI-2E family transporter [Candidatus Promineifilaceae bacterium]